MRSFELEKKYTSPAPEKLRTLVAESLAGMLKTQGYDSSPESVQINEVLSVSVDSPDGKDSKRMTMLHLTLKLSVRTRTEGVTIRVIDPDTEEVSLFATEETPVPVQTHVPEPEPAPETIWGPFEPFEEDVTVSIPVFPVAEDAFGMDISTNYENELWSVAETADTFVLEARRYGHGVGMSQRGAQWMAEVYEKNYREILGFYYPGMELMEYPEQPARIAVPVSALAQTAGPAPSPTPRPTLMPMTLSAQKGQYLAEVTGISEDSSLNLRAEPSLNGTILMRLYKGQKLLVVEECMEEGWVKVRTDATEGFVVSSYLTAVP